MSCIDCKQSIKELFNGRCIHCNDWHTELMNDRFNQRRDLQREERERTIAETYAREQDASELSLRTDADRRYK